jgi:hypothetical protein
MPARKPASLNKRHDLKTDRKRRAANEAALIPKNPLKVKPPARLTGHVVASVLWRRLISMYSGLAAEIVSRLDEGILVEYCITCEESVELEKLRLAAMKHYNRMKRALERRSKDDELDPKLLIKLSDSVNWSLNEIVKLDSRVDRKRALLHVLRQSLYLTPRSRAGVTPQEKAPEPPKSEIAELIDG